MLDLRDVRKFDLAMRKTNQVSAVRSYATITMAMTMMQGDSKPLSEATTRWSRAQDKRQDIKEQARQQAFAKGNLRDPPPNGGRAKGEGISISILFLLTPFYPEITTSHRRTILYLPSTVLVEEPGQWWVKTSTLTTSYCFDKGAAVVIHAPKVKKREVSLRQRR